jgi:hypothetical protein
LNEQKAAYDKKRAECTAAPACDEINLDMRIRIVDGDDVLADTTLQTRNTDTDSDMT